MRESERERERKDGYSRIQKNKQLSKGCCLVRLVSYFCRNIEKDWAMYPQNTVYYSF